MSRGNYNAWVEKSLARLAELKPGRYAKAEISTGFLDAIDSYTYRVPAPSAPRVSAGEEQPAVVVEPLGPETPEPSITAVEPIPGAVDANAP